MDGWMGFSSFLRSQVDPQSSNEVSALPQILHDSKVDTTILEEFGWSLHAQLNQFLHVSETGRK